ncbi:Tm-1-like ATP-binding domain-containing protein [Photorhabdus kleinii]|uniref:Tm-1-like ATP-binding domain-containing protein n=1 Tax=Photorhabdus kleinii TaxID=768034 RepID=UPI0036F20728
MHRDGKGAIPGSIGNYVTGMNECSQQRGNLKDNGYIMKKSQGYVYIATIFDTKRAEIFYVRDLIKKAGLAVRTVDLSTQSDSP